ncbi:hypothetical protein [Halorubrum lacusprofundi]|jgi:hypothetical protein|uniref:Uncharacterized protein n=1 Tax=Halorubrum lacusprofundi (strain ATCC 49239 / DSM 5036 / JCM 8891 / ACAM 34) TaxID=416348 RepID=B9LUJ3_HALLT|nr:hypothetical protein [Halorubrum lacusprofundi]ACM56350.1 hypothetical protein Hlac_0750 [Halorubrum lacusprofundi ATCC 49239]
MPYTEIVMIGPNDKYREVICAELPDDEPAPETEAEYQDREHSEAAENYQELIAEAPTPDDIDMDLEEMETLSWDILSVASDPDLAAKVATYFDGVDADEPTELIRAKLRLLDVDIYVDAQVAAREELRG